MVEAMLCGIPVASYNVIGPKDVVINGVTGVLNDNLYEACIKAYINSNPLKCINHARSFTWDKMVDEFIEVINLSNLKNKLD
jgi:glycosyltransferase involved in cell wall biosynthesis